MRSEGIHLTDSTWRDSTALLLLYFQASPQSEDSCETSDLQRLGSGSLLFGCTLSTIKHNLFGSKDVARSFERDHCSELKTLLQELLWNLEPLQREAGPEKQSAGLGSL